MGCLMAKTSFQIYQNTLRLRKKKKKVISHLPSSLPNYNTGLPARSNSHKHKQWKFSLAADSIPWKVSNHLTIAHNRHNSYVCLW